MLMTAYAYDVQFNVAVVNDNTELYKLLWNWQESVHMLTTLKNGTCEFVNEWGMLQEKFIRRQYLFPDPRYSIIN
jgi:hypothetical protein